MFKSKSFDLKNDEAGKQREHLYQPRKAQWLKYIMQPAAIAFVILLIICNIDFSYDPDEESASSISKATSTKNSMPFYNQNLIQLIFEHATNKTDCREHLSLRLENYNFPNGLLKRNNFYGEYTLQSLVISNCRLRHITDGAFDQQSLHNLQNLELINNKLRKLTNETFRGLKQLSNFTLISKRKSLRGKGLLMPVAQSLRSAIIRLPYTRKIYKPTYFFGQAVYKHLKVLDLSGNNIGETVDMQSFENMPALEYLSLANCRLRNIHFDLINELQFLDLSGNKLTELSTEFILAASESNVKLNLMGNNWDCSYANLELFQSLNIKPCLETVRKARELISSDDATDAPIIITTTPLLTTRSSTNQQAPARTTTPLLTTRSSTKQQAPARTTSTTTKLTIPTTTVPITTMPTTTIPSTWTTAMVTTEMTETTIDSSTTDAESDDDSLLYDNIVCVNAQKESLGSTAVAYNATMTIVDDSENTINVTLTHLKADVWSIMYFSNANDKNEIENSRSVDSLDGKMIQINYLSCGTSYIFCLIIDKSTTSPFNCRSHRTKSCLRRLLWFEAHSVPIIVSAICGMLVSVTLGLFGMYGILWIRPTWLWGSKRLLRPTSQSTTMLLLPSDYEQIAYDAIRYKNPNGDIHEYASYYRHLEAGQLYRSGSNKYNMPPIERAPSIPPSVSKSTISTNPNTYTYESFEVYEELY